MPGVGRVLRLVAAGVARLRSRLRRRRILTAARGSRLQWPASGTITRGFGYDGAEWHPGIDIGTLRSLDITAAAPGVVEAIGYVPHYEGYGKVVLVDIGDGLEALYAHSRGSRVKEGEHVVDGPEARQRRLHGLLHRHPPAFRAARARRGLRSRPAAARYNPVDPKGG